MFRLLEDDNVIAVRLGARFAGWKIHVRGGYLKIETGEKGELLYHPVNRNPQLTRY